MFNLDDLAQNHFIAISNYVAKQNQLKALNESIKKCFSDDWDFKKLILAKPQELEELARLYKWKCSLPLQYFETLYGYFIKTDGVFFQDEEKKIPYRAYDLIQSLGISICPYCNRNTIHNLNYSKKRTSELDHFYPKSKYPFFAISFYNLIPSCKICNKIKSDNSDKEYINPYDTRFDFNRNAKFDFKILGSNFYNSTKEIKLRCKIDIKTLPEEKKRIKNNIKDFKLFDLYQNHKDIVIELIQKAEIYNDSYIDELFYRYEGSLFKNREDLMRLITCGYITDEEINKRPLSKLIKDISEELELI